MKTHNNGILNTYRGLPRDVYILFLGKMINCIGAFVHPLLALILTQRIGLSSSEAGLYVTLTGVMQAPFILLGGKLTDRIGRKKIMVIFQSIAAFLFIICGFIKPSMTLAFFIIAASCFSALAQPSYDSLVGDITNPDNRQASFSLIYIGLNLGFAIGPLIGGALYKNFLPVVFIGDAVTTLISVLLVLFFIKEPVKKLPEINDENDAGQHSLESAEDCSTLRVFIKRPILIYFSLISLIFQFAYSQWGFAVPLKLTSLFGDGTGARYFGILASCNGIIVVLFTPLLTALTKRIRPITVMATGGALYALSFGSCGFLSTLAPFFLVIFFITIGEILLAINSSTFITNLTPSSHRGRVNAVLPLIYGAGGALGPSIMGKMIDTIGMNTAWFIIGGITILGALLMYCLNYIKISATK